MPISKDPLPLTKDLKTPTPKALGFRMPAEWEPHERTWMAWPSAGYTLGEDPAAADEARAVAGTPKRAMTGCAQWWPVRMATP